MSKAAWRQTTDGFQLFAYFRGDKIQHVRYLLSFGERDVLLKRPLRYRWVRGIRSELSLLLFGLTPLWLAAGCGEANPLGRRAIYGAVSLQGKPLESGWVRFEPEDASGVNSAGQIEAGKYRIDEAQGLPPGTYRVAISSPDESQVTRVEAAPGDERSLATERVPAKYNAKSTLKLDVPKGRGRYEANFALE
jgi:hypothetical protein